MSETTTRHWVQVRARVAWTWLAINDRWATAVMLAFFLGLILAGITTSSIGMPQLTQDPSHPLTMQWGHPQWIRSDEYNVGTPLALSIMSTGGEPTLSPLGVSADLVHRYSSGGFFETVVFFQTGLLRLGTFFPQSIVFALYWWLPLIVLFLALPIWIEQIGGNRRLGWFAALLIAFAPVTAWWSQIPTQTLAFTIAGCAVLIAAYKRFVEHRFLLFGVLALVSGILLASIPTVYQPWSIVVGVPFLLATVIWIATRKSSWVSRIVSVAVTGVIALLFAAGTFLENLASTQALLSTVYPGQRRSTAIAQPFGFLFGAPGLSILRGASPTASNASELSTAFTVVLIWFVIVALAIHRFGPRSTRVVSITFACAAAIWTGWVMVGLGRVGEHIPLLNLVPPARAGQVLGILGIVLLALVLDALPERGSVRLPITAAVICGVVTAYAVSLLRVQYLPNITMPYTVAVTIGTAVAVFLVTWRPKRLWTIATATALSASVVIFTQPVLFGLGDLRSSSTAKTMSKIGVQVRADHQLWASDSIPFDSMALANGVPTLSGFQRSGPDRTQWKKLDPTGKYIKAWNRAGGYIPFFFTPGEKTKITTNGFDVTDVSIDPCVLKQAFPSLVRIASTKDLEEKCLTPTGTLEWSGGTMHIYSFATTS